MKLRVIIISFLFCATFIGCKENVGFDGTYENQKSNNSSSSESNKASESNTDQSGNNALFSCSPGEILENAKCDLADKGALLGVQSRVCNSGGVDASWGSCQLVTCKEGYYPFNGRCVAFTCQVTDLVTQVDCRSEIPSASSAVKSKTCNVAQDGFIYGACTLQSCNSGYLKVGNECKPMTCNPNQSYGNLSCSSDIPFATAATKSQRCNAEGSDYVFGTCQLESCQSGYYKAGSSCVPYTCKPSSSSLAPCEAEILHASSATKTMKCSADGATYTYGACELQSCQVGYRKEGNSCVANACNPNQSYGFESCKNEMPHSAVAQRAKTCNSTGSEYVFGRCDIDSCESGYIKVGNSCMPKACNPNQSYGFLECSSEIVGAREASKTKTCNSQGTDFVYGTCQLDKCQKDYVTDGNRCRLESLCSANKDYGSVACSLPNASSATQAKTCNANGSAYILGPCSVKSCNSGFALVGNSCVGDQDKDGVIDSNDCDPKDPAAFKTVVLSARYYFDADEDGVYEDRFGPSYTHTPEQFCVGSVLPKNLLTERPAHLDNCPRDYNPDQRDSDRDGTGDACSFWTRYFQTPSVVSFVGTKGSLGQAICREEAPSEDGQYSVLRSICTLPRSSSSFEIWKRILSIKINLQPGLDTGYNGDRTVCIVGQRIEAIGFSGAVIGQFFGASDNSCWGFYDKQTGIIDINLASLGLDFDQIRELKIDVAPRFDSTMKWEIRQIRIQRD